MASEKKKGDTMGSDFQYRNCGCIWYCSRRIGNKTFGAFEFKKRAYSKSDGHTYVDPNNNPYSEATEANFQGFCQSLQQVRLFGMQ